MGAIKRSFLTLIAAAVILCCMVLPASAFAGGGQENGVLEYWDQPPAELEQSPEPGQQPPQGEPLSTDSPFSTRDLLYDKATHKQFISVEGRDGNTFYIVIDYDAPINDKEEQYKTYFLNAVDESDLTALVGETEPAACSCTQKCAPGAIRTACPLCAVNMTECVGKEPEPVQPAEPEPTPEPEPEKTVRMDEVLTVAFAVILAGAGAAYFLKIKKKKADVKGGTDLDDYDYGEEDEREYERDELDNEKD